MVWTASTEHLSLRIYFVDGEGPKVKLGQHQQVDTAKGINERYESREAPEILVLANRKTWLDWQDTGEKTGEKNKYLISCPSTRMSES